MSEVPSRIPQIGDPVRVRGTAWVVTGIDPTFDPDKPRRNHVVTLRSIGEDDRGASKKVIWEIEPGRAVLDRFEIPVPKAGGWDRPDHLDAFLRAVQWGSVTNADQSILEAPFRSGIDLKTYQLEPLVRALDMSRALLLIADDVGLGKTIEAGLVLQEFILRHRVGNCLIVCPASLVEKWQIEMRERFGIEFRVLDTAYEREVAKTRGRHVNPLRSYPWLVTSIDWMKRDERFDLIDAAVQGREPDEYPRPFDMLIVDEAHLAAPAGKNYPTDSQRTTLIDHFGAYFQHRLFLTATPHNGHPESFWTLLALLDRVRFQRDIEPTDADSERTMVRRLKRHVKAVDPTAPFPDRVILPIAVTPTAEEANGYDLLDRYLDELKSLNPSGPARSAVRFMAETLRKRFLSSPAAFARTIGEHAKTIANRGVNVTTVSETVIEDAIDRAGDSFADDDAAEEALDVAVERTSIAIRVNDTTQDLLDDLIDWGNAHGAGQTGRATALLDLIEETCKADGEWSDGRLIVFTEYRDTHKWLTDRLISAGVPRERIASMYGGMPPDQRSAVAQLFNREPGDQPAESAEGADLERLAGCDRRVRVLLATDTASEGIDLQRHCHDLLHFDVPYNPSRMEQRNGRIDRHGQPHPTADIHIYRTSGTSAFARDTGLESRIAEKLATIAADVGSANPLLLDELQRAHQQSLLEGTSDAIDAYDRTAASRAAQVQVEEGVLELRRRLAQADTRLAKSRDRLGATPEGTAHLVAAALEIAGEPALVPGRVEGTWALPGGDTAPGLSPEWTDAIPELLDRMTGQRRLVTFDPAKAGAAPQPVLLHLNHPFVAHAAALLRAQTWARTTATRLSRTTVRTYAPDEVDDVNIEPGDIVAVAHARVLVTGGTHLGEDATVLHEDVVARAARHRNGRWAQISTDKAADAAWAARLDGVPADPDRMIELWSGVATPLSENLTSRAQTVAEQLAETLRTNQDREINALREDAQRIREQMRTRVAELADLLENRLEVWEKEEKDQMRRNLDALRRRLDTIDQDIDRDIEAIAHRYDDIDTFVMPVALTFLAPEGDTDGQ